jgi:hypothetical protein
VKIEVIYKISPTYRHIYHFEIYPDGHTVYEGIAHSRRNNTKDVWGDKWTSHFAKIKDQEIDNYLESHGITEPYIEDIDDLDWNIRSGVERIEKKYNPICQKTLEGKPYYTATYFGSEITEKPIPNKQELSQLIAKKMKTIFKKSKFCNL